MKTIFFDTGPIISLALNNLLDILPKLKKSFGGEFYFTQAIRSEVIDTPLQTKKFKFEAIQVLKKLEEGVFKVYNSDINGKTEQLLTLANNTFRAYGKYIQIVHYAEMEALAAAILSQADAIVIDERTTRSLIENPIQVKERLEKKLHTNVEVNRENFEALKKEIGKIAVLRSFELVTVAYEKNMLDEYILHIKDGKKELLEGVLWGIKLSGCAVSEDEIDDILRIERPA